MKKVVEGVSRFQNEAYPKHRDLFEKLSTGQSPEVLFITCADSRIDSSLITQTAPGDLFVIRNAGNIVPPHGAMAGGTVASIEFAVGALGTTDIVVCGHSDCGAMKGALAPEGLGDFPHVCDWLQHSDAAVRVMKDNHPELEGEDRLNKMIEQNVVAQLNNIRTHPFVAAGLAAKKVRLHGWVYNIGTGVINVLDHQTGEFEPLSDEEAESISSSSQAG